MKKLLILLSIVVILPIFTLFCSADESTDKYISDFEGILPDGFENITDTDRLMEMADMGSLISELTRLIMGEKGEISSFFFTLIGSLSLMALATLAHERLGAVVESIVGMICSVLIFSSVSPLINTVTDAVRQLSDFFGALIPIVVGISALGGETTGASVQASGMYTALSAVGGLGGSIFLSLSSFGMAMSLLSCFGNSGIQSICRGLRGFFGWVTGIFTALLTAAFSLQTIVASSVDSAAIRAVRYAASGLIPVVGSTVSGAMSTLAGGLSYAKGVVGGGAIVVILYMALVPMALLLIYRLMLSLSVIFADFCSCDGASRIFSAYRFSLDMIITVYALSALIYLFEIVIITMMGVRSL